VPDIREGVQVTKSMADLLVEYAENRIGHFPRALFPPLVTDVGMCADLNLKVSVAGDPRPHDFNLLHGYGIGDAAGHLEYCPPDALAAYSFYSVPSVLRRHKNVTADDLMNHEQKSR
jgi:hypothetical protein